MNKSTLEKYKQVIDEWFVNGFKGGEAYKKIYPKVATSTANVNFVKLKDTKEIQEYIKERHGKAAKVIDVTHEGILQELKNWIESDITEAMCLTPEEVKELPIELRRLITKFKTTERDIRHYLTGKIQETIRTVELHFASKEKAMEMINKHIGFYEKDNKQKASEIDYNKLSPETLKELLNARV